MPKQEAHLKPQNKSTGMPHGNPNGTPGSAKGNPAGALNGTGDGGARSNLLLRSPRPPYPQMALQMHIAGEVKVRITVENGTIVNVDASGPPILASAASRWVKANWKFNPTVTGTFVLPVSFVLH
ncbi:MAG: energy transducer TonB [Verrucomicrobia bacterium]|nr:energy transducer TonB [Verrucomicrobiota bacterium]